MEEQEIDFKFLYPNLIIFIGPNKNESLFKHICRSFHQFKYMPIFKQEGTCFHPELGQISNCRIIQGSENPVCLAYGEGAVACDAEQKAVEKLMKKLLDSCYVIEANPEYFTKKKVPPCALNADPSESHTYKVVFVRKNSRGVPFPKEVSGAINYVENYKELTEYIETHSKSGSKADLFILNVLKSDRVWIRDVCARNGLNIQNLVGCSNMGIYVYRNMSTNAIVQGLLETGGKTVKYKLIGPRDQFGENCTNFLGDPLKKEDGADQLVAGGSQTKQEEIVINPWIADRLILMEVVAEFNELEPPKELIWRSVRDCPDTMEFIIEKKRNNVGMIIAEAMIDRNVIARVRGFDERKLKIEAAEIALNNLMKCCYYIQAKKSYFGSSQALPNFLRQPKCPRSTRIYRIAERSFAPSNVILKQFKTLWQEDLYFLQDYTIYERNEIYNLAKQMNFLARWIGKEEYLCVYKRRKPKEVFEELMATPSKENEKYKLFIPPAKGGPQPGCGGGPNRDVNRMSSGAQANCQPVTGGQNFQKSFSPSNTQAAQSSSGTQNASGGNYTASQSCSQGGETFGEGGVTSGEGGETSGEGGETSGERGETSGVAGTPDWVMKFIQSSPSKPPKIVNHTPGRDDVYFRFNFKALIGKSSPIPTSSMKPPQGNFRKQNQIVKRDQVASNNQESDFQDDNSEKKLSDKNMSLSERLAMLLEQENNHSGSNDPTKFANNQQELPNQGNKRIYNPGNNVAEDGDSTKKLKSNFNCFAYSQQNNNVSQNINSNVAGESSSSCPNPHDEATSYRRAESSQLWNKDVKQQYDQRSSLPVQGNNRLSNLFDYTGPQDMAPQGPPRSVVPPRPPPRPWKKNKQFRGHKFNKLAKYGKQNKAKGPY